MSFSAFHVQETMLLACYQAVLFIYYYIIVIVIIIIIVINIIIIIEIMFIGLIKILY